ncbi:MAG: hypothetical protein KDA31_12260 [Phycisphaerales bacterium]|nr:hypothetical protein [Phycisphaerales bacterium]
MTGALRMGWLYALRHKWQTLIVSLCVAATVGLPVAAEWLLGHYERELSTRAASVPLVAGTKGSRFDLAFSSLYYRVLPIEPATMALADEIAADPGVIAVPMHARFTAHGMPLVAIGADYFDIRGLRAAEGTLPLMLGDAVLGASVAEELAEELGIGVGDSIFSDQRDLFDLSVPPPLKMKVVGVLERTGSADDHAVFTDIATAWVLEGLMHGHLDESQVDDKLVMARTPEHVALSPSMSSYNEITAENIASFHAHADPESLPITGVLIYPRDDKAKTLVKARINNVGRYQAIEPGELVDELFDVVFRVKIVFDWLIILMGAVTVLLVALVSILSTRLRRAELDTLEKIGASGVFRASLVSMQLVISITIGVLIGLAGAGLAFALLSGLIYTM